MEMVYAICRDFMSTDLPTLHRRIILNGGDAPLHPDFPEICKCIREISGSVVFSSNGILIKDVIHLLRTSDAIQISIDGDQDTHDCIRGTGNYDVAVEALHLLNEHQIPHSLSFTIHRENLYCLDHIMDLAIQTKSALLNINCYSPVIACGLEPISYNDWIRLKKKARIHLARYGISVPIGCTETGCIGGILGVSILPDGTYWDCSRNQKVIGRYPQKIGDVLDLGKIADGSCKNQFETCLRRIKNE
ncbi:MAG: hypothetical protein LUQ50_09245 [Methanospirillum sp.]|nr:hypothetical protein [Methanospirillum sp.]